MPVFMRIIILETFIPPPVEPAHEPTNISTRSRVCENTGHCPVSVVENPAEVMVDATMKNVCLTVSPRPLYI